MMGCMPEKPPAFYIGFLRSLERYTQTDMVYLAHGGLWLGFKTLFTILFSLALSVAMGNLLPRETYGEYKYIFSLFSFFALTTLLGMSTAATKAVAQGFHGTTAQLLRLKMRYGLLGSLGSLMVAGYYFYFGNERLAEAFIIVAAFLPFIDTHTLFNANLTGRKLFQASTIIEFCIQLYASTLIVGTLFLTNNLLAVISVYFFAYTSARLVAWKITQHFFTENFDTDPNAKKYGMHLSAMQVFAVVAETVESMLLWQFLGPAALAVYAFAKGIPAQMSNALQRLVTLAFPKFAERDYHETKRGLTAKMWKMLMLMVAIVIAYILAAPTLFKVFFPQYLDAVLYSQIFALTLLFFPQKFIGTLFQAQEKTRALYITSTVVPMCRIVFLVILIPRYGIPGALASELLMRTVNLFLTGYLYSRHR